MAFLTWRSSIQALLTLETDLGISRMSRSSPYTLSIGRTVGRICSEIGTSLTVYASKVVTFSPSAPDAVEDVEVDGVMVVVVVVVVVGAAGGGVEDWARSPTLRMQATHRMAGYFRYGYWIFRCMRSE